MQLTETNFPSSAHPLLHLLPQYFFLKIATFLVQFSKNIMQQQIPFENLNQELIFHILDCLSDDPPAKKSFSLVSKSFHSIESMHRRFLKPLRTDFILGMLKRYPQVSHIDFTFCPRVDDDVLVSVSDAYGVCLRGIDLSRSRFFTSFGLSSLAGKCGGLVEVDLSNGTELTDLAAAAIAEAKNLERLSLARCRLISDIGLGCIAVGCKKLRFVCLKWCVRLSDLGVGLIAMKCKEISSLDLSYCPITENCLGSVLQLEKLNELILVGCSGIDDKGLMSQKLQCRSLEKLDLSSMENISHIGIHSLTAGMERLSHLILKADGLFKSVQITNDLAKCWQNSPALECIKLDECDVTHSGLNAIAECCTSLKELSLSKCKGVSDEGLSLITEKCHGLRKLDITCCRKITYASLDSITSSCTALTSLKMECCTSVPEEAFALIGQRCTLLEELDVTENEVNDEGLREISRCKKLLILKLGICTKITDNSLSYIGMCCRNLTHLDLYRCTGITDVGIIAVANGCHALEMINMAYCKISDISLKSLSKCWRLKALEIRGCLNVTSPGLAAIAQGCRRLAVLDIKKCRGIDDSGLLLLARHSSSLHQINISHCSVTDVGIMALAGINRLRNLTVLHVKGLSANGISAYLFGCQGLAKVKLHTTFKASIPLALIIHVEARGCVFQWRNKAY